MHNNSKRPNNFQPKSDHVRRPVKAALLLATLLAFSPAHGSNRKGELQSRPAIPSTKAASALLTDVSVAGKQIAVVGERGHILTSTDDGATWRQATVPVQVLLTGVYFVNEQLGWAVGHEGVILGTRDGGATWEVQYANPYKEFTEEEQENFTDAQFNELPRLGAPLLDIWFRNENEGFAVGAYGMLLHTSDGGRNWDDWSARLNFEDGWHLNTIGSADGNVIYVAGEKGVLFRSQDGGQSWHPLQGPYEGSFFGILVGPTADSLMVFGLQGNLFRSHDQGNSWEEIKSTTENSLMGGVRLTDKDIVLVGNSGVILTSKDAGLSYTAQITKDRQAILGIARTASGKLLMVGQGGVKAASPAGN